MAQIAARDRITCPGCDASWTGTNRAHCSGCHRTYSGPSLFTAHRITIGHERGCADPTPDMRLVDGIWRGPEFDRGAIFRETA